MENMKTAHNNHIHNVINELRNTISQQDASALLITNPENVRYLSNFSSAEDGRVLITPDKALLITDGRYDAQSKEESTLEVVLFNSLWQQHMVAELLGDNRLAIEASSMTVSSYDYLNGLLKAKGREAAIPSKDLVSAFRVIKTDYEIATLRQAAALTDEAFSHILGYIKVGMKEVEVALELERFMRINGAEGISFDIIVASGYRSAMPHGQASQKVIEANELVTIDMGAKLDGYHADMTRTIAMGELSERDEQRYHIVLEAQEASLEAITAGKNGHDVDEVARAVFRKHNVEQYYPHGLGHGVGLNIHEAPRLSIHAPSSQPLKAGMAVTVEPGIYIPGESGVRIEDLVIVSEDGYDKLSHSSKELISL